VRVIIHGGLVELVDCPIVEKVEDALTFKKWEYQTKTTTTVLAYATNGNRIFVPRNFYAWHTMENIEVVYNTATAERLPDGFQINEGKKLYWAGVDQEAFIDSAVSHALMTDTGGYGISPCGTGKTLMGVEIIRRLGRPALIILNRTHQVDQWLEEFDKSYQVPPGMVGVYKGQRKDVTPIVVATIQSLVKERRGDFFSRYATAIFDEGHHLPADTWMQMLARLRCKWIFALTAGFHRTDGLDKMFQYLLGGVVAEAKASKTEGGSVYQVQLTGKFSIHLSGWAQKDKNRVARAMTNNNHRNMMICRLSSKLVSQGRDVLVFSSLRDHLQALFEEFQRTGVSKMVGFFVGGMTPAALHHGATRPITLITYEMGKEALNLPHKDTIICASPPPANLQQLKGRIDRVLEGKVKNPPLVIDFVDFGESLRKKARKRAGAWRREGMVVYEGAPK